MHRARWTPREDRKLVREWALHGSEKAARDLGRSKFACRERLRYLRECFPELFADLPLRILRPGPYSWFVHPTLVPEQYRLDYARRLLRAEGMDGTPEQAEAALRTIFRKIAGTSQEAAD
jgi:hypothetical protein